MHYQPIVAGTADCVSLAELIAAFSYALDITEGQPAGHSIRSCWIGSQVGQQLGLDPTQRDDLYYTLLLKDLGCSSNAARICELYQDDDRAFKQGFKTVGTSLAATIHFVFQRTARGGGIVNRARAVGNILANGDDIAQQLIVSRCTRGADIARQLRFSEAVSEGIYRLDEHWDGSGRPGRLRGDAIPQAAQIALLAQVADVFHGHAGRAAALDEVRRRAGSWFDPRLVAAFERAADLPMFWQILGSPVLESRVVAMAPGDTFRAVDEDYLDDIAAAFGAVIDAKSPYTAGHSGRVGTMANQLGYALGMAAPRRRWLARAALLHDIGKLGVSNAILDKPGKLNDAEWVEMRGHASHTRQILGRIGALSDIADIAAAHHERIDGTGYPLHLDALAIRRETRIITACDFYDALTSDRPYRAAMDPAEALAIMDDAVGSALDGDCFEALRSVVA